MSLNLNGRQIYTDKNGHFSEVVILFAGYNVLELKARDKFGREQVTKMEVVYRESVNQFSNATPNQQVKSVAGDYH